MLRRLIVLCLVSCQMLAVQPQKHTPLPRETVKNILSKFPELKEQFYAMDSEYKRYFMEVGRILSSDDRIMKILQQIGFNDEYVPEILANQLQQLKPELRSQLDEVKRVEVNRLMDDWRRLVKESDKAGLTPDQYIKHLDARDPNNFEPDDLRYLLKTHAAHVRLVDTMRRQIFKEHLMKKQLEEEEKVKHMNEKEKTEYMTRKLIWTRIHEERKKKMHHPGSEEQFKDIWENTDQMQGQPFNPTTFFLLHDLNGDQALDEDEVKALFYREIQMLYKQDDPDFDPALKTETTELMREHYFDEADTNQDRLITMLEFKEHLKTGGFLRGDRKYFDEPNFTKEELEEFEKNYKQQKPVTQNVPGRMF